MLTGDDSIYIVHSPFEYAPDPINPSPFDNELVLLIGNDLSSVASIVVAEFYKHPYQCSFMGSTWITSPGTTGHLAAAPVYQHEAQVNGTPNTSAVRGQKFCLLPPSCHQAALTNAVNGHLTLLQFYTHSSSKFLWLRRCLLKWLCLRTLAARWYRLACHRRAGAVAGSPHTTLVTTTTIPGTLPTHVTGLTNHIN